MLYLIWLITSGISMMFLVGNMIHYTDKNITSLGVGAWIHIIYSLSFIVSLFYA